MKRFSILFHSALVANLVAICALILSAVSVYYTYSSSNFSLSKFLAEQRRIQRLNIDLLHGDLKLFRDKINKLLKTTDYKTHSDFGIDLTLSRIKIDLLIEKLDSMDEKVEKKTVYNPEFWFSIETDLIAVHREYDRVTNQYEILETKIKQQANKTNETH